MFKTFASALACASVSAYDLKEADGFSAMAIPDYVAGLIYGLTGDNHLEELETCFHVTDDIVDSAKTVINDFAEVEIIHAFEDLGDLASKLPPALDTCTGMQDDFQKIAQWADIWTHPLHLAERLGKNWLLYHFPIHKDMKLVKSDWDSEDYWGSGVASADFLTKMLTPGLPASAVPKFLAGFVYKFVGDNHLAEIEGCVTGGE